ncbi:glucosyltransferase domain-containing protein [Scandinavium sp. V105_16]|uniref:Glucosyltransferase domain-containing protein n=1 Tax=Scandinavium lactucae TaxID=3095028 RepID=A0AAJ2SBY3_9ENTR|nr:MULTISPECIES: glucosyltransferase domain-containing protein [unclassified Scandinavium]MDX6022210.1 glucosyltransferase domain-containing protein [Scandinavium sp. V105_16]MDX6033948.1 glucosyltransferase domain-containing protein [Scandinavium sp. V105_12]
MPTHARNLLQTVCLFSLVFALFISVPLWTNKIYYGDDFFRLYNGDGTIWLSNGRPLTTLLHYLLAFNTTLIDISPIPLLAGLTALSFSAALFVCRLQSGLPPAGIILLSLGVLANPFLSQPMLYIWDSFSILLAISLAMLAAMYYPRSLWRDMVYSAGLLLSMLMLYQIAINLYLACVVIVGYRLICLRLPLLRFLLIKAVTLGLVVLLYKFFIAPALINDNYSLTQSEFVPSLSLFITALPDTLVNFYTLIQTAFPGWRMSFVWLPGLVAVLAVLYQTVEILRDRTRTQRIPAALFYLFAPVLIVLSIPGVSIFLKVPLFAPRVMASFSAYTLFCMLVIFSVTPPRLRLAVGAGWGIVLLYSAVSLTTVFNTLNRDQQYLSSVMWMIKADVARVKATQEVKNISFIGTLVIVPDTAHARNNFPLVTEIRPAISKYTYPYFLMERSTGLKAIRADASIVYFRPEKYVSKSCDYTLYMVNSTAVVNFNTLCQPN